MKTHKEAIEQNIQLEKSLMEARAELVNANMRWAASQEAVELLSRELAAANTSRPLTFDQVLTLVKAMKEKA